VMDAEDCVLFDEKWCDSPIYDGVGWIFLILSSMSVL
jgi:hypothetical protein